MEGIAIAIVTLLAISVLRWPMLPVLLVLAPAAILIAWLVQHRRPTDR